MFIVYDGSPSLAIPSSPSLRMWYSIPQILKKSIHYSKKKRLGTKLLWKYFLDSWRKIMTYMRQGSIGREEGRKRQKPCIKIHFDHGQRTAIYHGWFIVFLSSVRSSAHIHIAMLREQKSNKCTIKQIRQINAVITKWRSVPSISNPGFKTSMFWKSCSRCELLWSLPPVDEQHGSRNFRVFGILSLVHWQRKTSRFQHCFLIVLSHVHNRHDM